MSRTKNSAKNIVVSVFGQFIQIIFQFVCRTVFINTLTIEYLGINGLFSNVLSMLSLAELGFGTALIYSMYKPVFDDNKEQLTRLVNLYRKIYLVIAGIILLLGLGLLPFLKYLINDYNKYENLADLSVIFLLYLVNTIFSYLYIYKKSIIDAYQKNYMYITIQKGLLVTQNILQIIFLLFTHDFVVYLIIQIIFTAVTNIIISAKADLMFPFLRLNKKILPTTCEKKVIYKNTAAMAMHKIGAVVVNSTDNLILSSLVSLGSVAIYANYLLIIANLNGFIEIVFKAVTASIGNLGASNDRKRLTDIFDTLTFIEFWVYSFSSICLYILLNHFITIWIGKNFLFTNEVVFTLVLNFYLKGMRVVINVFRDSLGLFWYDRYKPILEALVNLVVSIILTKWIGIAGVFAGTAVSTLMVCFWIEPYILYKYALIGRLRRYFVVYFKYVLTTLTAGGIINIICNHIKTDFFGLIIKMILVCVVYNLIILLLFRKSKEYIETVRILRNVFKRKSGVL